MVNYIGIDPSTKTGLVILNTDGEVKFQKEITTNIKHEPLRFMRLSDVILQTINKLCKSEEVKIAIEGFSYGSRGKGVSTQYGIGWGVRTALVESHLEYTEVAPTTLKKFATGKGNTKKEDMILPINDIWGFRNSSDNIRDAYVMAQIARALDGKGKFTKAQLDCLKNIGG